MSQDRSHVRSPSDDAARPAPSRRGLDRLGRASDAAEIEAARVAADLTGHVPGTSGRWTPVSVTDREIGTDPSTDREPTRRTPESVAADRAASGGVPLPDPIRTFMEDRFGHDFGTVRIHADAPAGSTASSINANAYTIGDNIVFGPGAYAPETNAGVELLAHELVHVVQDRSAGGPAHGGTVIHRQERHQGGQQPTGAQPANQARGPNAVPVPRRDYVFIMGQDRRGDPNRFYHAAERYFRAKVPRATFVTNIRNLTDLLAWIAANVQSPIGNLYIVSHANEDGTLSFGLDAADQDHHLDVRELTAALNPAGGHPALASVSAQIDGGTRIRIKGCDIGRTQEMVELLDRAFGGAGTVTAPTHEQGYSADRTFGQRARTTFRTQVAERHPPPPPIPSGLRGRDLANAQREYRRAAAQRAQDIATELRDRHQEEEAIVEAATVTESFSGPMFQRPGRQLFTAAEIRPQLDTLYGHLSAPQRASLAQRLIAADPRSVAVANQQGLFRQQGQRAYRLTTWTWRFTDVRSLAEAQAAFRNQFQHDSFQPRQFLGSTRVGAQTQFDFSGVSTERGPGRGRPMTYTATSSAAMADADLLRAGRERVPNPGRYAWRIEVAHAADGRSTQRVMAERVVAYLHHGSLNIGPHAPFTRPETDPSYFATSTFAPPPPPPPARRPRANP